MRAKRGHPTIQNLRLKELVRIVNSNRSFYEDFVRYLRSTGYCDVRAFIREKSNIKAVEVIEKYLSHPRTTKLYNGVAKAFPDSNAQWFFLAWMLRDAPTQRLAPLLNYFSGRTLVERKANLLNELRKFIKPLLPNAKSWSWPVIAEVMLTRLEGSRRALKGNIFDNVVREAIKDLLFKRKIPLNVSDKQVKIMGETYDVEVVGRSGKLLFPVKTRETMGGGHALLFTRDIHKAISVAQKNGYVCIPIIIAESWSGDLSSLNCKYYIHINLNPNQLVRVKPILMRELNKLSDVFLSIQ